MSLDTGPLLDAKGNPENYCQAYIRRFNALNKVIASMPDFYQAGKSASPELLRNLRIDIGYRQIVSSTNVHYKPSSLEAVITHYFGSKVIRPKKIKVLVPVYDEVKLNNVLRKKEGLRYLQALFNTNDDAKTIKSTLEKLSNQKSKDIIVITLDRGCRYHFSKEDSLAGFSGIIYGHAHYGTNYGDYFYGKFRVQDHTIAGGRSREVLNNPVGNARKNITF